MCSGAGVGNQQAAPDLQCILHAGKPNYAILWIVLPHLQRSGVWLRHCRHQHCVLGTIQGHCGLFRAKHALSDELQTDIPDELQTDINKRMCSC